MDTPQFNAPRILLFNLPGPLEKALLEQMAAPFVALNTQESQDPFDLALFVEGARPAATCGVTLATPLLEIDAHKRHRLGVILRQAQLMLEDPALYLDGFMLGDCFFDSTQRQLSTKDGQNIALTDRETDILVYLARHHARAVPRDELLQNVWRYRQGVETHTLETHIYRLRQKLEISADDPKRLITQETGYRLIL